MIEIYAILIINKRRTFDSVPSFLKAKVKDTLIAKGYDTDANRLNSDGTVSK